VEGDLPNAEAMGAWAMGLIQAAPMMDAAELKARAGELEEFMEMMDGAMPGVAYGAWRRRGLRRRAAGLRKLIGLQLRAMRRGLRGLGAGRRRR
jgi:hypothetical protein